MASSSQSNPFGPTHPAPLSVDPFRDRAGFLPLVTCEKCRTKVIARVSQKKASKGKTFYKCPFLEHTEMACGTYMFEEDYVEYLVAKGHLPRGCSRVRGPEIEDMAMVVAPARHGGGCSSTEGVEACEDLLISVVGHLKDSEDLLKSLVDSHTTLSNKVVKLGEWLLIVAIANLFILVLALLVEMFK